VLAVSDRVTVLRGGRVVATLDTESATPEGLAALMVGREVETGRRQERTSAIGDVVLEAHHLHAEGDRGLPALNGVPYTHKPPMLFWLVQLGWGIFGVNSWWPRMIPPLAAIASVWLVRGLAARLHPGNSRVPDTVAWLLGGTLAWALFSTVLLFDLVLTVCVLGAIVALERVERAPTRGWALFTAAVGAGLLTKGPATLVFALPPALLGPWWIGYAAQRPWRWYGGLVVALAAALAVAGVWVLLAYEEVGTAFVHTILWDQSATRVVHSFAHARPWWFYLPVLPIFLLPWIAWPTAWRALLTPGEVRADRLVMATVIPSFVVFSLISGKQPHLLPIVPMCALRLGSHLARRPAPGLARLRPRSSHCARPPLRPLRRGTTGTSSCSAWVRRCPAVPDETERGQGRAVRHLALSNAATIGLVTAAFFAAAGDTTSFRAQRQSCMT
jgi:hypothetical protein